ncbi:MAG TPA: hypothetical protein VFV51_04645 [Vicinamibacterales bacterium]|nr:hypothetical protein [Vicinamibacterales bacterium]
MPRLAASPRLAPHSDMPLEPSMKRLLLTFAASWFLIATIVASAFAGH